MAELALLRSAIGIVSMFFVLTLKNNISLRLQLLLANAWLFSADKVAVVEGVAVVGKKKKENFLRETLDSKFLGVPREGYSQTIWVGVCGPLPKTLTLFMTKICDFPYPIYDLTKNLISYL